VLSNKQACQPRIIVPKTGPAVSSSGLLPAAYGHIYLAMTFFVQSSYMVSLNTEMQRLKA